MNPLRRFKTRATVDPDGRMTLQAPKDLPAGEIDVWITLQGAETEPVAATDRDTVAILETNIDDMNPEVYGYLVERILSGGAKDAYLTPIIMKKGRPGVMVTVLADPADADRFAHLLMEETTTLGVRVSHSDRYKLPRTAARIETDYGPVGVKLVEKNGGRRPSPEYEDCARIAAERGVPILDVYAAAQRAWEEQSGPPAQP